MNELTARRLAALLTDAGTGVTYLAVSQSQLNGFVTDAPDTPWVVVNALYPSPITYVPDEVDNAALHGDRLAFEALRVERARVHE